MCRDVSRETEALTRVLVEQASSLPTEHLERFAAHFALLLEWNKVHNLTRVTRGEQAALKLYLDSWLPLVGRPTPSRVVDIGSGAGFPGFVAATLFPSSEVTMVEAAAKRVSFLRTVRARLGMNFKVLHGRSEQIPELAADLVTTRATFTWPRVIDSCSRQLSPGGTMMAWCGPSGPTHEEWVAHVGDRLEGATVASYRLPDGSERCLLTARRRGVA